MNKKTIFLDADGTLCDDSGRVTASTRAAIKLGQENGHRFFLCTGRAPGEITEELLSLNLDGIIGGGGSFCEVNKQIILNKVFEKKEILQLVHFMKENQIEYYLGSNHGLYASTGLKDRIKKHLLIQTNGNEQETQEIWESMSWFLDLLIEDESKIDYESINKLCFVNDTVPFEKIYEQFHQQFYIIPSTSSVFGNESGEIGLQEVRKQTAIEHVLNYLSLDSKDTIAFGDGLNDIDMFDAVEIGVAMDNACEELKAVAHMVTASNEEDGIALGLKKLALIS